MQVPARALSLRQRVLYHLTMGPRPRLALGAGCVLLVTAMSLSSTRTPSVASASPHGESKGGGELRLMWGSEPVGPLDFALSNGGIGGWILLNATCAKLVRTEYDADSGKPRVVPEVAVNDPKITDGGRTYTFELKRTFRFHTGERVTAQSFADAFNRAANPKLKSPARSLGYLREIVGIDAAMEGTAPTISGVRVLGRYRLQIRLKQRAGDFKARLTMPYFCPISDTTPLDRRIDEDEMPGSGPYHLVEHTSNRRIVLERNPYRGERTAYPDRIVWTIEPDWSVKIPATEHGTNDFTPLFSWPKPLVRKLVDTYGVNRPGARVIRDSVTQTNHSFRFNLESPAFKGAGQKPLRKAITYALDRPALTLAAGYLEGRTSDRLLPATLRESRRLGPVGGPDLATARKWARRTKHLPTTLTFYSTTYGWNLAVAQEFKSNLRRLGIDIKVRSFEFVTYLQKLSTPGEPWDVAWIPQGAPYPDPVAALFPFVRGTRYETRLDAANQMADAAARTKALAELEADLMRNDPPVAVWADFTPLAFVSKRFGCWGADSKLDLAAVCKK
jgi:ABC-type oligopeptide transport system substrate-binding subunit